MCKPYSIFKRHTGIYYVQFRMSDGSRSTSKSTGCRTRIEAERKAMEWVVNGQIPSRTNGKESSNSFSSVDKIKFMNDLRTSHFTDEEIRSIIKVLKERKFISSAVICKSPEDKPIEDFLLNFWDFEKSPYVKEKKLKNQTIHQSYCATMKSRVKLYWIPMLMGRSVGSITRKDVQQIFNDESILKLAPKTINSIVSSLTVPLKWAFFNDLTENNCFDGILKCGQKSQKRDILTLEQAAAVFATQWENDSAKLANELAFYTGMRQGEIAGVKSVPVIVKQFDSRDSTIKYEYKMQFNSRRLSDAEYFVAFLKLDEFRRSDPNATGKSDAVIGKQLNKPARQVSKMREMSKKATPELLEKIKSGDISLNKAYEAIKSK